MVMFCSLGGNCRSLDKERVTAYCQAIDQRYVTFLLVLKDKDQLW